MDDLTRLFRFLVARIQHEAPDRLASPFQVSELYQRFAPYRQFKAELGFDTIEDYEMALLRLLAGEGGLVQLEPEDARKDLANEVRAVDPDTGAFRVYAAGRVTISGEAVLNVLGDDAAFRPPEMDQRPEAIEVSSPEVPEPEDTHTADGSTIEPEVEQEPPPPPVTFEAVVEFATCPYCSGTLPPNRVANFCPHCGCTLGSQHCTACGEPSARDWSFCLGCGHPLRR